MKQRWGGFFLSYGTGILIAVLYILFVGPVSADHALILLRQTVSWFPSILGELLLMMVMGYNLSVGGQVMMIAFLLYLATLYTTAPYAAAAAALVALSAGIGAFIAFFRERTIMPPTAFTYCMQFVLCGISVLLYSLLRGYGEAGSGSVDVVWKDVPALVIFGLLPGAALAVFMTRTGFGRGITLLFHSPQQAELSGMPVQRIRTMGTILGFALIGFGAIAYSLRVGITIHFFYVEQRMLNYTCSILAGVSMSGLYGLNSRNLVPRAVFGSLCLVLLAQLEQIWNIDTYGSLVIAGAILLFTEAARSRRIHI